MDTGRRASDPLSRYLVELTPDGNGVDDIQALAARCRAASEELSRSGTPVRFLRSVFVPEDGTCLLLFEGPSAPAVEEAGRRAALPLRRVSGTLRLPRPDAGLSHEDVDSDER